MGEEIMVTIPLKRFEQLLEAETRGNILIEETKKSRYNVERERIATIFGFKLPKEDKEEGRF